MVRSAVPRSLASDLIDRIAWVNGHADVWRTFSDGPFFARLTAALAEPYRDERVTKVAGVEARGFILGAAVAAGLGAGFVAIRKQDGLFPGEKLTRTTEPDYRGNRWTLRLQRASLVPADRVLLVDDWAEVGSQAHAARLLIEDALATWVGASIIVDQLSEDARRRLGRVEALVRAGSVGLFTDP